MKKEFFIFSVTILSIVCVCALCGCLSDPLSGEWEFSTLQEGATVVACSADNAHIFPDAEVSDISIKVSGDSVTLTLDGESVTGSCTSVDPFGFDTQTYVVVFGDNECTMTVGDTTYLDGSKRSTLILSGDRYTAYFYGQLRD